MRTGHCPRDPSCCTADIMNIARHMRDLRHAIRVPKSNREVFDICFPPHVRHNTSEKELINGVCPAPAGPALLFRTKNLDAPKEKEAIIPEGNDCSNWL